MKVTARVQRSGAWWAIEVPEVPGVFTQAKRLEQVAETTADAVATMLDDVDATDVQVTVTPVLPEALTEVVENARAKSEAARSAADDASRSMRHAVSALRSDAQLTTRDTAQILGITYQRVSQLENS